MTSGLVWPQIKIASIRPSEFFDKFKAAMNVVLEIPELRGVLSNAEKFFVENYDKEARTRKCLAGLNSKIGGSHIEKECPHCNEWHYKMTVCPNKPEIPPGGSTGGSSGGSSGRSSGGSSGRSSGGSTGGDDSDGLPAEVSSYTPLIGKVILKLVQGDETNEEKIQQARDYLNGSSE